MTPAISFQDDAAENVRIAPVGNAAPASDMFRMRPAAPALILLLVAAVLSFIGMSMGDMAAPHVDVTSLPTSFGPWVMIGSEKTSTKLALPYTVAESLSLDSYTDREYVNRVTGQRITMLVEYRRLGRGAFNHRPEACYPAAGFVLTGRAITRVEYGRHPASAITCVADYHGVLGTDHQVLLYWFGTGARTETNFFLQQVEMAFGRLRPDKNGWVFVRLIEECPPGEEAASLAGEKDFVAQASPALIQTITPASKP